MPLRPLRIIVLTVLLAACHGSPPATIPVSGGSMNRLSGEWAGSYQSPATGRSGSIVFTFVPGQDVARGDVIMVPAGNNVPLRPLPGQSSGVRDTTNTPQVLSIEFVRATGDSLSGTMAPYEDPECHCAANAVFRGKIEGNVIRGTFVTTWASAGRTAEGTWEIHKR